VGSSSSRQEKAAATAAGSGVVGGCVSPGALYWRSEDWEGLDSEADCRIFFGCNC
jgi:hypothetical protein